MLLIKVLKSEKSYGMITHESFKIMILTQHKEVVGKNFFHPCAVTVIH